MCKWIESNIFDFEEQLVIFYLSAVWFFFPSFRYEVNFQDGIDCGGAYIKLLADTDGLNLVWYFNV